MVAYSFKARFAAPILAGTKAQTIRADRRRHARPGEPVHLFTGMRTKHCRRLGEPVCIGIAPVRLCFSATAAAELFEVDGVMLSPAGMERFAQADGFASVADMAAFWRAEHPSIADIGEFRGWLIRWAPLLPGEPAPRLSDPSEGA